MPVLLGALARLPAGMLADHEAAVPGAIVSAPFAACVGLYLFVLRVDAEMRR